MLMYDVDQRDAERKKARREKDEMSQEMKELKKLKETEQLYQREERKLFLGGLSMDTVRRKSRTNLKLFIHPKTILRLYLCDLEQRQLTARGKILHKTSLP